MGLKLLDYISFWGGGAKLVTFIFSVSTFGIFFMFYALHASTVSRHLLFETFPFEPAFQQ